MAFEEYAQIIRPNVEIIDIFVINGCCVRRQSPKAAYRHDGRSLYLIV